ncbi:hypothetical protein Anas_06615 [Armadillidium nasatum]|uniref:GST N-terminal domain-containing protein n=1 Tax=Armadillidium nasatum TaxID=96803 RepID=A0A5N5SPI6_9CRUS|nr:hypothetical protein Anas_06615 [Armadillidium nasatum]
MVNIIIDIFLLLLYNCNLLENEQSTDEYKKLNPMSQVPALIVDGKTITQSVREINELIASGIQPLQNLSVSRFQKDMSENEWCAYYNRNGLKRYKIDLEEFPTIARIYENLKSLEVFKAAHPLNQPDAPPKNENEI